MFFENKKFNTFKICFKLLFFYFIVFPSDIPSESFYKVGKSLRENEMNEYMETGSSQDIYNVLDEIYYLEVYIDQLKSHFLK